MSLAIHEKTVSEIQSQLHQYYREGPGLISLNHSSRSSYTIRTKQYKNKCREIDSHRLNQVIKIDPERQRAIVEPRLTMEKLLKATLPYGLTAPVVPEFMDITVGGAIMGVGGESACHAWGTFNDSCEAFTLLTADGSLLRASCTENADLFYAIPGSYGAFGTLVSAEVKLIPAQDVVHLRYHIFDSPQFAVDKLLELAHSENPPDFLDGMIFSKNIGVAIEANLATKENLPKNLSLFSLKDISSPLYYQHTKEIALKGACYEELMSHEDYFFRYDLGSFWMSGYIYHAPFFAKLLFEGYLKWKKDPEALTPSEVQKFHKVIYPSKFTRTLCRPLVSSRNLCRVLHHSEKWVQKRLVIQDFCIPEGKTSEFLADILQEPGIFPIWLLPIKGTRSPQIFAPHLLKENQKDYVFNFGIYGIPATEGSIEEITRHLERKVRVLGGRKLLYSHSYYTEEEFWQIYSRSDYDFLREKTRANGYWHDITDKVLSN